MLDFPKIMAFIWLQTKHEFPLTYQEIPEFLGFSDGGCRRAPPSNVGMVPFQSFQEEVRNLQRLSTYSISSNFEALDT